MTISIAMITKTINVSILTNQVQIDKDSISQDNVRFHADGSLDLIV